MYSDCTVLDAKQPHAPLTHLLQAPEVVNPLDRVRAALDDIVELVPDTFKLLAMKLADDKGVGVHHADLDHLDLANEQNRWVLLELLRGRADVPSLIERNRQSVIKN